MRPIINMLEKDRAMDIGNMNKKFGKDRKCGSEDIRADRQADRHTHHKYEVIRQSAIADFAVQYAI